MTDEMKIQNQQPSALPYILGGGAGGAAVGTWGLPRIDAVNKFMTTPPKYSSYEEIINEADDKFTKAFEEATGDERTWMEKARDARKAGADAGEKWEKDFEAFKAEKLPNLEEGNGLLAQKAEKEALIKTLEADSGKVIETVTNGTKEVTTTVQGALNKKAK